MSNIRVHKKINLQPVTFGKESIINVFYCLIKEYNKQETYKDIIITRQQLWEMAGFEGKHNTEHLFDLIRSLTKSETYNLGSIDPNIKSISGSMFVITSYPNGDIKIEVPKSFQQFLFYKQDLDLMYKAKHKKTLTVPELEYYDKEVKPKSKFLVLLKKADILGVKGKYNKRLYSLLMQFKKTGLYFTTWKSFKEILEIPETYRTSNIEQRVLKPARKELSKVGIKITDIKKIKNGRCIDKIEIRFKYKDPKKTKEKPEVEVDQKPRISKAKELGTIKLLKAGKHNLIEKLLSMKTDKEVDKFMKDNL